MTKLLALCTLMYFSEVLGAISTDCTKQSYVNSKGFTCFACGPGFYVTEECTKNGTTNICAPCPDDHFHSTCSIQSTSCKMCSLCLDEQKMTRNCTKTQDTVCICIKGFWDTYEEICILSCPPGRQIAQGEEGNGQRCVSCEAGTFSSVKDATKCQQCTTCSEYKKHCTKTSDAVCTQLTTEQVNTTTTTTAATTKTTTTSSKDDSNENGIRTAFIVVAVILVILVILIILIFINRKKLGIKFCNLQKKENSDLTSPTEKADTDPENNKRRRQQHDETEKSTGEKQPMVDYEGDVVSLDQQRNNKKSIGNNQDETAEEMVSTLQ